jgi:hypothetical protein
VESDVAGWSDGATIEATHVCPEGALSQAGLEASQGLLGALRHHLHTPVGEVPDVAKKASGVGLAHNEVSIADTLDSTLDEVTVGRQSASA